MDLRVEPVLRAVVNRMRDNPELQADAQTGSPEKLFVPAICVNEVFKHVLRD
jgi:hypothetical protein